MENMVKSSIGISFFNGQEVTRLFNDAEDITMTTRVSAYIARVLVGKGKAGGAKLDGVMQGAEGFGKILGLRLRFSKDIQSQSSSGFSAYAGKASEVVDEPFKGRGNNLHGI
jgi:hypothetical protein